ncbi:unnamed protein product [Auanema sp. JU1783]|nr:unnamed protein product [Auanema sp. JU1783]
MSGTVTPSQRAFVGKRSKMTAADVRRHIMTGSVLVHSVSLDKASGSLSLSLLDVVDPCDIEEALGQRKTTHRKVCEFPSDDIDVRLVDREISTLDYPFINDIATKKIESHVKDILLSYNGKFSLVQRRHQQFGSGEAYIRMMMERPIIARTCAKPIFEFETGHSDRIARSASLLADGNPQENLIKRLSCASSASTGTMGSLEGELREPRLHMSHPDPIIAGITQKTSYALLDQQNENKRKANRSMNIVNLLPMQMEDEVIERRSAPSYPEDKDSGHNLLIKVMKLSMEPTFEPVFGSMAIYDARNRRKLTESFYFDVNSEQVRSMLKDGTTYSGPHGRCNHASFFFNGNVSDIFIVVKLEKVLNACEVSDAVDAYCSQKDEKSKEKLLLQATEYCSRLGRYRMPMGFMVVDVQKVLNSASSLDKTDMTASAFACGTSFSGGDAPLASSESDTMSIMSVDRVSISSTSTFRRMGSGTSASTMFTRVRTPLQKRKNLDGDEGVTLTDQSGKISDASLSNLQTFTLSLNSFFRYENDKISEEDLFKLLSEARKAGGKLTKLKTFPVDLVLQLSGGSIGEDISRRISPEFLRVAPFSEAGGDLLKEVQKFSCKGNYAVLNSYKNLLYIYPKHVNFSSRQGTARNISIRVELMNDKEVPQLVVFPNNAGTSLSSHGQTTVIYHSKIPQMADEVKIAIPVELDDGFHLLFTFYHISCKAGGKDEEFEYPIGYSWLPLYRDGKLTSGDFNLPICIERPPNSYGYLDPEGALPNIKWLDGHKPLFNVFLRPESSVHPQDEHLERFFVAVSSLTCTNKRAVSLTEEALIASIRGILKARPEPLVAFLYNVLDKLVLMITDTPFSEAVASASFETLGHLAKICTILLDSCLDNHGRSSLLASYVHFFKVSTREPSEKSLQAMKPGDKNRTNSPETQKLFNIIEGVERASNNKVLVESANVLNWKLLHEELADLWVQSYGQAREMAFLNAWFLLELMLKSMAEYLSNTGRLYLVRRSRFAEKYLKLLESLSNAVLADMNNRLQKDARQAFSLAHSWAFFLRDAFSLMDRTFIMKLVKEFVQDVTSKILNTTDSLSSTLMLIKLDFIRIICSHEHFVILNLPFAPTSLSTSTSSSSVGLTSTQLQPPSPGASSLSSRSIGTDSMGSFGYGSDQLNPEFRRFHFLVGIVLSDLSSVLEFSNSTLLYAKAIGTVRNLIATHEADNRLSDISVLSRVAALYFPLINIVMDNASQLFNTMNRPITFDRSRLSMESNMENGSVDPKVALAIAGIGSQNQPTITSAQEKEKKVGFNQELSRQLLSCYCWVLQHLDESVLRQWIRDLPPVQLAQFIGVLDLSIHCFELKPTSSTDLPSTTSEIASTPESKSQVKWRKGVAVKVDALSSPACHNEVIMEGLLSSEITLCVLEAYESIIRVVSMPGNDHLYFSISMVFRGMIHILSCNQSVVALENVFASLRALFLKYPEMIFEQETEQCAELCLQLLKHCASRLAPVRSQAAASLYLLMRESFDSGNSFARLKMQITMALSTLVSNGTRAGMWLNEDCLRRSLKTVLIYAETDCGSDSIMRSQACFSEQVKDLIFNLHMILSDTVKMKEYANDYEMTMDLMYRVAKGYQNNPDLRLTWLLNMASRHTEKGLQCEAGQCLLHASALAAEYIAMTTTAGYLPSGAVDFHSISANILEESAVSDDVISPETDGVCESKHFTSIGLVQLIDKCASYYEKAQMYELLPDLFKVIEPTLREWRDFRRLASIHARLSDCLSRIEPSVSIVEENSDAWLSPLPGSDKRCFGTYFRVGFYGSKFGDLDGEEFIYKEPPFTKLSEISNRLELFYTERFGKGVVEVIKDSNNVSRSAHQPNNAYLQITYVEPYFDKWERRRRPTHFERSHNINRFSYATPFTRDGRAHGDLKDQCKRRTVLTAQHCFPYLKTRIRVISREQKVLLPIQVAIEDIEKKTRELSAAIAQNPPDAKMLQMVLQGCIGTTVNQGPIQVANIFLREVTRDDKGKPVDKFQNKLRLCFKDLSKKCCDALALNKQLIQPDQQAYQNELQRNYNEFLKHMSPILEFKDTEKTSDGLSVSLDMGPATEFYISVP